ncbi:MAG: phospholipase [Persephonella sp.]|nr:MAG: phospholipase [Persephonella sp.]
MKWIDIGKRPKKLVFKNLILDENSQFYKELINNLDKNFIANLGHSTFLIQIEGLRILTDPFLSPHILGVKRKKPALLPKLVPKPDFIVISHAHYDHLDLKTLKQFDKSIPVIIPDKTKAVVKPLGFKEIIEVPHFKDFKTRNIEIIALPVQHNKGRSLLYPNTQTNSYIINVGNTTLYFAGDTGYFDKFKEYGKSFNIDYAFLPIGGFEPRVLLQKVHMNPEEAVKTFKDLNAKYLVPIHFDTFHTIPKNLKKERALERLNKKLREEKLTERAIIVEPNSLKKINITI